MKIRRVCNDREDEHLAIHNCQYFTSLPRQVGAVLGVFFEKMVSSPSPLVVAQERYAGAL